MKSLKAPAPVTIALDGPTARKNAGKCEWPGCRGRKSKWTVNGKNRSCGLHLDAMATNYATIL